MFTSFTAGAQDVKESEVPPAVVKSFKAKYPGRFVYEWELKKKTKTYEGEFMDDGVKYEAQFNDSGEWLWTKRGIEKELLPEVVLKTLSSSEYASWKTDDIEEHQSPAQTVYTIEVERGKKEMILYFLSDGTLQKAEEKD